MPTLKIPIEKLVINLKEDKERLRKILDRLHESKNGDILNDRLIHDLSTLEFEDERLAYVVEFIVLILTNMTTNSRTSFISMLDEFTNMIEHNLEISLHLQDYVNSRFAEEDKKHDYSAKEVIGYKLIRFILPSTKLGNTVMWVLVLFVVITSMLGIDYIKETISLYIQGQVTK